MHKECQYMDCIHILFQQIANWRVDAMKIFRKLEHNGVIEKYESRLIDPSSVQTLDDGI
jgi:hypothetical protein